MAKAKLYRDCNSFDIKLLKEDLDKNLKCNNTVNFSDFRNTFTTVLYKHAPIKKKILRFNNNPFMSKALRKAIMHRSKLKTFITKKEHVKNNGIFVSRYFGELRKNIFKI